MLKQPRGDLGQYILTTHDLLLCRDENYKCSPERLIKAFSSGLENSQPDLVQNSVPDKALGRVRVLAARLYDTAKTCPKARPVAYEMWSALAAAYISPTSGKSDEEDFEKFLLSCVSAPQAHAVRQDPKTCKLHVDKYNEAGASGKQRAGTLSIMESCVYHVLDKNGNELLNLLINVRYEVGHSSKKDRTPHNDGGILFRLKASSIDIALAVEGSHGCAHGTISGTVAKKSFTLLSRTKNTPGRLRMDCDKVKKFYVHVMHTPELNGDSLIYKGSSDCVYLSKFNLQMKNPSHLGKRVLNAAYNGDSAASYIVGAWAGVANNLVQIKCFESSCTMINNDKKSGISYAVKGCGLFRVDGCLICADIEYVVAPLSRNSATRLTLTTLRAIIGQEKFDSYVGATVKDGALVHENITYDASIKDKFTMTIPGLDLYKAASHKYARQQNEASGSSGRANVNKFTISASQHEIAGTIRDNNGILNGTGIVRDTMEKLVSCVLACSIAHVSQIDHRIARDGVVDFGRTGTGSTSSAGHVLEEHFLFHYDHSSQTMVHVCARYTVGNYHGIDSATLSDLKVGFRMVGSDYSFGDNPMRKGDFSWIDLCGCKAECNCGELREKIKTINPVVDPSSDVSQDAADSCGVVMNQGHSSEITDAAIKVVLETVVDNYAKHIDQHIDNSQRVFTAVKEMVGNPFCSESDTTTLKNMVENGKVLFVSSHDDAADAESVFFGPTITPACNSMSNNAQQEAQDRVAILKVLQGLMVGKSPHYAVLEVVANILSTGRSLKIVQDICEALSQLLLYGMCGVCVVDHRLLVDNMYHQSGKITLTHSVLLSPRVWWAETGRATGSVPVSIMLPMRVEQGAASLMGYIALGPVRIVAHKLSTSSSYDSAEQNLLFEKTIKTFGCCVSLQDVIRSSSMVYSNAYAYTLKHSASMYASADEQSFLELKIQNAVKEFVNLYGICCVLEVPDMSFETRSDVCNLEGNDYTRDLAELDAGMLRAIKGLLMKSSCSKKLMEYVVCSLEGAKITISGPEAVCNDESALMDDKGIKIKQQCVIEIPSIRNSNVSASLVISYNAQMRRKILDRWVIAVPYIEISHTRGLAFMSERTGLYGYNESSIMRISSACIALLVTSKVVDDLSQQCSYSKGVGLHAKVVYMNGEQEGKPIDGGVETIDGTGSAYNAGRAASIPGTTGETAANGSGGTREEMDAAGGKAAFVVDSGIAHGARENTAAIQYSTNSKSQEIVSTPHTKSVLVDDATSQGSAAVCSKVSSTQEATETSVKKHMGSASSDPVQCEESVDSCSAPLTSSRHANVASSAAITHPGSAVYGKGDDSTYSVSSDSKSEVKQAQMHAALYGALREQAFPDDRSIKKLLGTLVNIATDGKIMCTDAYVGGRVPLRTSYTKSSDNGFFVTCYMIAESARYGVLEIELQYDVVKTKNPQLAGGVAHTVNEGKFFIKGNNNDLVRESVHRITKPIAISETKWNAFVVQHKKCLDLEKKKLGFWYRFTEFVGKMCKAIVTFLCKICSYFSCIFCCFFHKAHVSKTSDECIISDGANAPTYKTLSTDVTSETGSVEKVKDAAEAELGSLSSPSTEEERCGTRKTPSTVITESAIASEHTSNKDDALVAVL